MMGPDWWLKASLEEIYNNGFRRIKLKKLYIDVVLPVINILAMLIVAPYVIVRSVLMFLGK
jgi:E3 ubiquitin-protein ligase MARCH6